MSNEDEIRKMLDDLHKAEDKLNKRMTKINWEISLLEKEKKKIAAKVSNNMRHRNILIEKLPDRDVTSRQ